MTFLSVFLGNTDLLKEGLLCGHLADELVPPRGRYLVQDEAGSYG